MAKAAKGSAEHTLPLYMNGLSGRMLRLPSRDRNSRELLLVYGHHSSIERMIGLAEYLNKYCAVTMPDLPGFGGMQPFYKIGQKPTLDALADYLAAFVKLRYRGRRFSVAGLSFGFVVITRMLQKYPEIAKKVDLTISIAGFAHRDDFAYKKSRLLLFKFGTFLLSNRLAAAFIKYAVLRPLFIQTTYRSMANRNPKLKNASSQQLKDWIEFEITLWRINDPRTYMETGLSMLTLKPLPVHVDLAVHHVALKNDRYFNNIRVEQHLREIYTDCLVYDINLPVHAPSVLATARDAAPFIPPKLRNKLRQKSF